GGLRLLERLLNLEHLGEQIRGHLGLGRGLLPKLSSFLEGNQVLDPREGVAQRPVGAIEEGRGLEGACLRLCPRSLVEVGMVAARELVEASLERLRIDPELPRQPEHLEVVGHDLREMRTGPRGPVQDVGASLRAAYATVLRRKRGSTATARFGL